MKRIVILDPGHGGVEASVYKTPGKRSPFTHLGPLYEGEVNRFIVFRVMEELSKMGVPYLVTNLNSDDMPLDERVDIVNRYHKEYKGVWLLSVHSNAGGGNGREFYTSPGQTQSDLIANDLDDEFSYYYSLPARYDLSDGDRDKEANFKLLTKTTCPAVLWEVAFMDNDSNYSLLKENNFLWDTARRLATGISKL